MQSMHSLSTDEDPDIVCRTSRRKSPKPKCFETRNKRDLVPMYIFIIQHYFRVVLKISLAQ